MAQLESIRLYIPVFGVFGNRLYDEGFTVLLSSVVVFILFGYLRSFYELLAARSQSDPVRKIIRCYFCESSNIDAVVDPETDLCRSCGQLNAFEDDGDYSRPLPELYHAQMNKSSQCMTPTSKRLGLPAKGSPQPATAPGNILCARCVENQEKIVQRKATFVASSGSEAVYDREYAQFERQLEKDYALCGTCQNRVRQFVGEQDRVIAANVATTTTPSAQHRLFMAKRTLHESDDDFFVPSQRIYRRNKIIGMMTFLSAFTPLFWGPFDVTSFWVLRIFANFFAVGMGAVAVATSPYRRFPWSILTLVGLACVVLADLFSVFHYLKFLSDADMVTYRLKPFAKFSSSLIQYFPVAVAAFAFANAVSLMPGDRKRSGLNRQNSSATMSASPTHSEPYVASLLAETVVNKRRSGGGNNTPWRAFSSNRSVYMQSNYSPFSNGSASPSGGMRRGRPSMSSNPVVYLAVSVIILAMLVAYVFIF